MMFGAVLKHWRNTENLSQSELAHISGLSTKHLSFLETGKSKPTRETLDILSKSLNLPPREKSSFFKAAGFILNSVEETSKALKTMGTILEAHNPWPALVLDASWNIVLHNRSAKYLIDLARPALGDVPVNIFWLTLHPEGLAPYIENFNEWRSNILSKLKSAPELAAVLEEVKTFCDCESNEAVKSVEFAVPLVLKIQETKLSFITTTTVFGSPNDDYASGLAMETLLPLDEETQKFLEARMKV